ncbi:rab-GTPase-TBC domain-containing protein, partial [Dimargaris cristalligena]
DDDFDDDEDEDDDYVERDRYGFSKFNQYLSRDEYLRFEAQYGPIVEQRKIKWRQLFVGAGGQWPPRSTKVKRYIRKGIPSEIRGPCWFHYSGGAHKYRENPSTYRKWVKVYLREGRQSDFADIIERDLHRTFPDNEHFQMRLQAQKSCVDSLRRILNVFTLYCPHVGYNQSLSYIVGLLLLFLSEEQAFWMLVTIVEDLMPSGYFNLSQEYSLIDQEVLLSLLESKMPSVHRHLCREEPSPLGGSSGGGGSEGGPDILPPVFLAMSHWFPLLFVDVLPVESVLRVWDCFF